MSNAPHPVPPPARLRGVNLGGWLLLEKWMTPSLFHGLAATDETTWCAELGGRAEERLRAHWNAFITREDFAWIAERGLNAVRIPVGHWVFGPPYPYHPKYGENRTPFVTGGIEVLDRAFDWAREFGLGVLLDFHAAPGCQNGFDNGGIKDVVEWHTKGEYLDHSVDMLGRLAERYRAERALLGIEVLNEPRWDIPTELLKDFTLRAYAAIRAHCPPERAAVVFHDGFRPHTEYLGFLQPPQFRNVLFDIHRYQCFNREDLDLDIHGHMKKAGDLWRQEAEAIRRELALPCIVGEWSLGLNLEVVSLWAEGPYDHALTGLDPFRTEVCYRAYAAAQLLAFEHHHGWFFWSYRTENTPEWCLRECVERGWLPRRFR
ncbi:glucan 1,3-beta-glucosidase [Humidesulfovibrio mexicanus]|uniref:Exo-1,3-beta-glucanase D n=1 Tax=Humidesulfovibrio mexicanus TaxID=147047 RepID=A0A239C733_9BACT|nr:glycoside hydrolase family 5 protein [Humidesulfovibrio mexicanus]SNS15431.1 glucan 1,3-beta-glucosidase [Humidesulfovibrio mexicanus]